MAAKVLNIEICDQTITVCRTARKGKGVHIFDSFIFPTPEGCVLDGVISDPSLLGEELKKQFVSHNVQWTKNVVFALSSSKIAVREVKLPPMKKNLIAAAIKTNSEDYFPIDLKNYHIAYCVLDTASATKPYSRILVMAAPISILEGYFQLAEKAGLTIKAIDSSGNSQYQALKCIDNKNVTVFVDVGSSSSVVSFMREGKLLLQRPFAFGSDDLISQYINVSGKSREDYMEVLNEMNVTHPDFMADKLLSLPDIQKNLERLVSGIMRSIDYFNSSQWESAASRIVLVGINRHLVGLRDFVAESTGLETLYLDDISDFTAFTNATADAATFINCIGSSIAPLDLIPKQFLSGRKAPVEAKEDSIVSGVVVCCIIVAGAILLSLSSWLGYLNSVSDLGNVNSEITSHTAAKQTYDTYVAYQSSEQALKVLTADTNAPNAKLVGFFTELEEKMPSSILLLSAACSNDGISLNITVGSYTDAAAVISSLRSFDSLAAVNVADFVSSKNEIGAERISFTVNCLYGENPYLNNVNPYNGFLVASDETTDTTAGTSTDTTTASTSGTASDSPAQ